MKTIISAIGLVILVLGFAGAAKADTVELPLNCTGTYDVNTPPWTTTFDLGVTFSEISNVYIDWSGTITAEVAYWSENPDDTFPLDGEFWIGFYKSHLSNLFGAGSILRGADTYPAPEPFDSNTVPYFSHNDLSELLDGQASIAISFSQSPHYGGMSVLVFPTGQLNSATLIFEGTVVPEPSTILLLAFGLIGVRVNRRKRVLNFKAPHHDEKAVN